MGGMLEADAAPASAVGREDFGVGNQVDGCREVLEFLIASEMRWGGDGEMRVSWSERLVKICRCANMPCFSSCNELLTRCCALHADATPTPLR